MPTEFAKDSLALISYLLPGFVAAWVFYGLTSHPKPSQFERVVQALIFTFVVQALLAPCRWLLEKMGSKFAVRPWDASAENLTALFLAALLGVGLAYFTNKDSVHAWLRAKGFTTRTSHPSEWYQVLSEKVTYVILHLSDGRRLYGWPKEWPVEPDRGQFYVMLASWIKEDGSQIDLTQVEGVLVHAKDVKWIEFLHPTERSV